MGKQTLHTLCPITHHYFHSDTVGAVLTGLTASPDQSQAVPHPPHHHAVHQLQCGSSGQFSTVINVLGE